MSLQIVSRLSGLDDARRIARIIEHEWNEDCANDPFA